MSDIAFQPIRTVAAQLRAGRLSASELTRHMLGRIALIDAGLHSYRAVGAEMALDAAARADSELAAGRDRGPLHGIPLAVKDLCDTKGMPTAAGMSFLRDNVPSGDATVVARLKAAGAVILGKLHMTEGATLHHHPAYPIPVNPWDAALWPGASSSGCGVAVAAGLCFGAIGSDTGGSIRYPSACNGLTGLKPTWGLVSRHGVYDLAPSFDCLGPMARNAADAALILDAVAGFDPLDPTSLPGKVESCAAALDQRVGAHGLRIGYDLSEAGRLSPETAAAFDEALRVLAEIGADIVDIRFPDISAFRACKRFLIGPEQAAAHASLYEKHAGEYGSWLAKAIEAARRMDPLEVARAGLERRKLSAAIARLFEAVDVMVLPVFRDGTPPDETRASPDFLRLGPTSDFTTPVNAAGNPALTLQCGEDGAGAPLALQLVGPHRSEPLLLALAHQYQKATDWHVRHPQGCTEAA
jgi:amidase